MARLKLDCRPKTSDGWCKSLGMLQIIFFIASTFWLQASQAISDVIDSAIVESNNGSRDIDGAPIEGERRPSSIDELNAKGLIEIRYAPDILSSYRERRRWWAPVFGFGFQNVMPVGYVTDFANAAGENFTYEDVFGSATLPLLGFYGGAQFNLTGFSVGATLGYATGSVSGNESNYEAGLKIDMKKIGIIINLDSLASEPYVVPCLQLDANVASYHETFNAGTGDIPSSGDTGVFLSYTVGALFQLNWLDPEGAFQIVKEHSVNNSYLHIFAGQLTGGGDVSVSSKLALGAGFRLEF